MRRNAARLLQALVTLGAIGLAVAAFQGVDLAALGALLERTGPLVLLVLGPQLLGLTVETWGWQLALSAASHRVRFIDLWAIRTATEAMGQLLPGGVLLGEAAKPALLRARAGLPVSVGVGTTVHRKYLRLLGHGPYVLAAVFFGADSMGAASRAWLGSTLLVDALAVVGVALVLGALAMGALFARAELARALFAALRRVPAPPLRRWLARAEADFLETDRVSQGFFRLPARAVALPALLSGLAWFAEVLESWLLLRVLGADVSFAAVLGVDVAVSLARQLVFVLPAGAGLQEAGYLLALGVLGVPEPLTLGAAFVLLKRLKELALGGLGLGLLPWLHRSTPGGMGGNNPPHAGLRGDPDGHLSGGKRGALGGPRPLVPEPAE
jgi:uncharacterized protein (TIRG00374 family)